ncbi:MAG: phosphoglycerate kinase, partial [Candidatus Kapabacteria bacterium]|nr:phosphoglycerate kinase [Candidatus Kapabacteria bacterium]
MVQIYQNFLKELQYLASAIDNPKRPLCAILGGSKISGFSS